MLAATLRVGDQLMLMVISCAISSRLNSVSARQRSALTPDEIARVKGLKSPVAPARAIASLAAASATASINVTRRSKVTSGFHLELQRSLRKDDYEIGRAIAFCMLLLSRV